MGQLLKQFDVGRGGHEALDVGVALQEGLDAVVDLEVGELAALRPHRQGALLLQGRPARGGGRGGRGLRHLRGLALEGLEDAQGLGDRHGLHVELGNEVHHREGAQRALDVALPDVDGQVGHLLLADHGDVVPLRQLGLTHLLVQRLPAALGLGVEAEERELLLHPLRVLVELLADGHDHDLAGRQPQRPLAGVVLDEDGGHALDGAQDGAVDHDGALEAVLQPALLPDDIALLVLLLGPLELHLLLRLRALLGLVVFALLAVLQVEPDRVVEVELDGAALVLAPHGVGEADVDLRTVEGAVAGVQVPLHAGLVEGRLQLGLGVVPDLLGAERLLRARGQRVAGLEAEDLVDVGEEGEGRLHLLLDLVGPADNVRVVLLEAADAREAGEGAAGLVPVEDAEIRVPDGQLAEGPHARVEHEEVAGAVHRLEHPLLPLDVQAVHVVLVVLVVARDHEEVGVVHVRGDHFGEAAQLVLAAHELDELVVDPGAHGEPEAGAGGEGRVEKEELLLLADVPVVALRGLLEELLVLLHQLVGGEGDAVESLQRVEALVAEPVGSGVLGDLERLRLARVGQMGSAAEVDEVAAAVAARHRVVRHLVGDELHLEGVPAEELQGLLLREDAALEGLLLLADVGGVLLDGLEVVILELPLAEEAVVIEAVVERGADGQVAAVLALHRLAEDVRARVPEDVLPLGVVELQELHAAASLQRPGDVPEDGAVGGVLLVGVLAVGGDAGLQRLDLLLVDQLGDDDGVGQTLGDALRDLEGGGLERLAILHGAVGQLDLDRLPRLALQELLVLGVELVPDLEPALHEGRALLDLELALELAGLADLGAAACVGAAACLRHRL
mmetsp:Transcript_75896/g.164253  ORF Transcript_75896/g.164253 Transcript_75896/m.164253 type:complete len:846 (+) Transcript_75896:181-2718(+)